MSHLPRMLLPFLITLALIAACLIVKEHEPGSLLAVTLYKAHLMALGGWGGYWLDRSLFPYDRPHQYMQADPPDGAVSFGEVGGDMAELQVVSTQFGASMLRRAIIVAACLICVGLGA